jgi:hypothetical protein
MKTLYGMPYCYLDSAVLDVPERRRVVREVVRRERREGGGGTRRARRGGWWWAAVVLLGLVTALWPLSHVAPKCYNWWPNDILQAGWSEWPGLGSTVGNAAGHLFVLRGRMVEATDDPGGAIMGHWDLTRWYGRADCGMGTRMWGFGSSPKHLEQRGVMVPAWMVSAPAGLLLAGMWGKRRGRRAAVEETNMQSFGGAYRGPGQERPSDGKTDKPGGNRLGREAGGGRNAGDFFVDSSDRNGTFRAHAGGRTS